jgi:hypothetical protein
MLFAKPSKFHGCLIGRSEGVAMYALLEALAARHTRSLLAVRRRRVDNYQYSQQWGGGLLDQLWVR